MPAAVAIPLATAAIGAAGSVAAGAISGGAGKTSSGTTTSTATPWSGQSPFLSDVLQQASNVYNDRTNQPLGNYYAAENGQQQFGNQVVSDGAQGASRVLGDMVNTGQGAFDASMPAYQSNAAGIAQGGIGQQNPALSGVLTNYALTGNMPGASQANPALSQGVTSAALGSLGSLGMGQSVAAQAASQGLNSGAAMGQVVNGAGQYINNGVLQGQIDALGTDISRNLSQTTLPGIRAAAAANGNTNSSREGALEGIAGSQAQENLLNAAANIRGNAYNAGAGLANNQWATGLNTAVNAGQALNYNGSTGGSLANTQQGLQQQQGQFQTTSMLNAANQQQTQNLGWNTANVGAQLQGNAQLGNAATIGGNMATSGLAGQLSADQMIRAAGDYQQTQDQNRLTAADTRSQSIVNDYANIAQRGYNGANTSTSASTAQQGGGLPGYLQGGLGGALLGNGLFQQNTGQGLINGGQTGSGFLGTLFNGGQGSLANNAYAAVNPSYGTSGGPGTSTLQNMGFYNPIGSF